MESKLEIEDKIIQEFRDLGLSERDIERQLQKYYALTNDPNKTPEKIIKVKRVNKSMAEALSAEKDRKATLTSMEGSYSNINESTMNVGNDKNNHTIQMTFDNLEKRYIGKRNLEQQKSEIAAFFANNEIALRSLNYYWYSKKELISYWWLAANDTSPEITKLSSVDIRKKQFVYAFEDTLRSGNRDIQGNDDGIARDRNPSCGIGFTNKFCEAMFGLHPDNVFVGKIKPMMANLTLKTARGVYLKKLSGERKELFDALTTDDSSNYQENLINKFLSDVHRSLAENVKKEFGDNEKLFLPLIEEYSATAQYVPLPSPEEVEKNNQIVLSLKKQYKDILSGYQSSSKNQKEDKEDDETRKERMEDPYKCPITLQFMTDPVRLKVFQKHAFERSELVTWLAKSNYNPLTGEELSSKNFEPDEALKAEIENYLKGNDNKKDNKADQQLEVVLSKDQEMVFFIVFALEWFNKMPKELHEFDSIHQVFKQERIDLQASFEHLYKNHPDLIKSARGTLKKLKEKQSIPENEMKSVEVNNLRKFWTFDYSKDSASNDNSMQNQQKYVKRSTEDRETKANAEVKQEDETYMSKMLATFKEGQRRALEIFQSYSPISSSSSPLSPSKIEEFIDSDIEHSRFFNPRYQPSRNDSLSREDGLNQAFARTMDEMYRQNAEEERRNEARRKEEADRRKREEDQNRSLEIKRETERKAALEEQERIRQRQIEQLRVEAERIAAQAKADADRIAAQAKADAEAKAKTEAERLKQEEKELVLAREAAYRRRYKK